MIRNIIYFSILTTMVVLSWIVFSAYHTKETSTISSSTAIIIHPIPTGFDVQTIQSLRSRTAIPVDLHAQRAVFVSPTPAQNSSSASNSLLQDNTVQATPSAL